MSKKRATPEKLENKRKSQWLMQYIQLGIELRTLREAYKTYKDQLLGLKVQIITDMPMNKSQYGDKFSGALAKLETISTEMTARLEELNTVRKEILTAINTLTESRYRNVMTLRYIRGKKWEKICVETGYSWRQIHRIHGESLKQIHIKI